jgi:hypothetical protein
VFAVRALADLHPTAIIDIPASLALNFQLFA